MNALFYIRYHYWRIVGKVCMAMYCLGERMVLWYQCHAPLIVVFDAPEREREP